MSQMLISLGENGWYFLQLRQRDSWRDFTAMHKVEHSECLSLYLLDLLEETILKVLEEGDYRAILAFKYVRYFYLLSILPETFQGPESIRWLYYIVSFIPRHALPRTRTASCAIKITL
jgi:hypothetical protein